MNGNTLSACSFLPPFDASAWNMMFVSSMSTPAISLSIREMVALTDFPSVSDTLCLTTNFMYPMTIRSRFR